MKLTTIEKSNALYSMRAMALHIFPLLKWRHHGIGCLQGYVVEDVEPEVRIHIWSSALLKHGMDVSGDIHDHRFDMVSHVLAGSVAHEEIYPKAEEEEGEGEKGEWSMLGLTHARAAKETGYHGPTTPIGGRYSITRNHMIISQGYSYHFPMGQFHRSPLLPNVVAVTCVEKHNQLSGNAGTARLLFPTALPPVMAFGHEMDWSVIGPVINAAKESLRSTIR
jgi:hypothetical protein